MATLSITLWTEVQGTAATQCEGLQILSALQMNRKLSICSCYSEVMAIIDLVAWLLASLNHAPVLLSNLPTQCKPGI